MIRISPYSRRYLRQRSTALMTDRCTIYRPGPSRVDYDPATRNATVTSGTQVYAGPCRLWEITGGSPVVLGDDELVLTQLWFSMPYDAPVPEPEDQIRMDVSDDPSLVGRHLKVLSLVRGGGLRSSRRAQVQFIDSRKVGW